MNEYRTKHDTGLTVWMEHIETVVDEQRLSGVMFHLDGSDIHVAINSPFSGFNKSLHIAYFCRTVYPDGFNSDHGRSRGKELLQELYLEHREYAAVVKARQEKEAEELARTMSSEDAS